MSDLRRIGLGTAQFGADYGISNKAGRPDQQEVARVLSCAIDAGLGYLDTASGYGDAESVVGRCLPNDHGLHIVTKIPSVRDEIIGADHKRLILESIAASLRRLRVDQLHGVLVHHAADLKKAGWEHIIDGLHTAQALGWTLRIGASVYDNDQIALVESRFRPELIQLPYNVLDYRLADSGTLKRLKSMGVEVHARSIFLQGLLLMPADQLPSHFAPIREQLSSMHESWAKQGASPLVACLASVLQQPEIDAAIVGVNQERELREILAAVAAVSADEIDVTLAAPVDPIYLDPSKWPPVSH